VDLYLIRHAAVESPRIGLADEARALTTDGRRKWKRAVRGLDAIGTKIDRVYHSPWRRAVQTAEALRPLVRKELVATETLCRSPTASWLASIEGKRVAIVGHHPWLLELVGLLVFGDAHRGARITLGKSSVVHLEGEPRVGGMTLEAVLPGAVLRAL